MTTMPRGHTEGLDLNQLRVMDVLLRERSVTRSSMVLNTTQPALSKALSRLRCYFDDPLFIRVGLQMEPTPKALSMAPAVRAILDGVQSLQAEQVPFDPRTSNRNFSFLAVDAAIVVMLPPIVRALETEAPNVHVSAMPLEAEHLHGWLQSGKADLAIGSYPMLTQGIRRQMLFSATYMSVMRREHPRLSKTPTVADFVAEKHVLVAAERTGHAMQIAQEALEAAIPPQNITIRVPGFTAAVLAAKQTDALVTLPSPLAAVLARELDLELVKPPVRLPKFEIAQYWHERYHREPGNRWMRSMLHELFSAGSKFAAELP
ncbi:MAG: LysR family transcriptional regulator [Variovorax sp.]|nr:LysR family transcriptional regulator [Variovorax sp.]